MAIASGDIGSFAGRLSCANARDEPRLPSNAPLSITPMRLAAKSGLRGGASASALPRFDDMRANDFISNLLIGIANDHG
jgi:hypothetical protein